MTRDQLDGMTIDSPEMFEALLAEVIERATGDGVDVRGAWEFRTSGSTHDWEVEVVELRKDLDREANE
jgi:hypothetical protein